jgi:CBS domain-containing protein
MRTAQDIMTTPALTISPEADVTEAVKILLEKDINGLPVMDDSGRLVGIICRSDLIRMQKSLPIPSLFTLLDGFVPLSSTAQMEAEVKRIAASKVGDAMSTKVVSIAPDTGVDDIAALIVDKKFHTLPVMDQGKLLGVVGKSDVLRTLLPR